MILKELTFDDLQIYILNIRDEVFSYKSSSLFDWFTAEELEAFRGITSEKRKREYVAVRFILFLLGHRGELIYQNKIPKLKNGTHISISHSGEWVAVALSSDFPLGMDIERVQEKITRIYERFVHLDEREYFDAKNLELSTLLWSFKETVYKLMRTEGLSFSEQICIKIDPLKNFKAKILTTRGNFEVPLDCHKIGDYVLTFNTTDVQKTK